MPTGSDKYGAGLGFQFECPVSIFSKADAPEGKSRRIAGIVSTDSPDRQGETILQNGLDFSDFLSGGWYNDNHSKDTTGILGYPDKVQPYQRGQVLPDGTVAATNGTWAEGYLLSTKKADEIWELGQALQKTGRRLGFSVEGSIDQRKGPGNKTIAKARVRNVAVTNCPVNSESRMEVLARSLAAVEKAGDDAAGVSGPGDPTEGGTDFGLTLGSGLPVANMPKTGSGAGAILTRQDLEGQTTQSPRRRGKKRRKRALTGAHEALTQSQARNFVRDHLGPISKSDADAIIRITRALKRSGQL